MIQQTYQFIPRLVAHLVDDILDLKKHSCVVHHHDWSPLIVINKVGLSQATLLMFLGIPHSHAFQDGGLGMIWDSNSSNMEKSNVDEKEHIMGF